MKKIKRGIVSFIENSLYYLGTMSLFNLIYALKICGTNLNDGKPINNYHLISFALSFLLCLVGAISTIRMLVKDHSIKSPNTLGKTLKIIKCENITGDNFFSKYSILVLTGNSLPLFNNYIGIIIYIVILVTLGIVYTTQKMYFMNPCFGIMKYNVVKAICQENNESETYYFIYKKGCIQECSKIKFSNVSTRIIRLKEVQNET